MIQKKYFSFLSTDEEHWISACCWIPEGEVKGILQITHGMVEYKERYDAFATFMAENGYGVYAHDHLGHGDSVEDESEWGYIREDTPSAYLVEDMHSLRRVAAEAYPDKPYFMLGHSMGSYLLRLYLIMHGEDLSAAIIMGTGFEAPAATAAAKFLVKKMAGIKGWDHRSDFIQNMTYGKSYKKFDTTGREPEKSWLNRDVDMVRQYYKDPKCTFKFTLAGHLALFEAVSASCSQEGIDALPKDLPILLISGAEDPVGGLGEGVKKVFTLYKKAGIQDVKIKLYPAARHEILNELNKEDVYKDLLHYIRKYTK